MRFFNPKKADVCMRRLEIASAQEKDDIKMAAWIEEVGDFHSFYSVMLNLCIGMRYRNAGYKIKFVMFDKRHPSNMIRQGDCLVSIPLDVTVRQGGCVRN